MKINLTARLVAAVARFRAKSDIRYYLNGVYAEPHQAGGVMLVATNGHAMGAWLDKTGEIERPAILRMGGKLQSACEGPEDKRLTLVDRRLVVMGKEGGKLKPGTKEKFVQPGTDWEVLGKFPDWRKTLSMKECEPSLISALNPEYVAFINGALKTGSGGNFCTITMRQKLGYGGILCTSIECSDFAAVVMPVHESIAPIPKWALQSEAAPLPTHQPSDAGPPNGDGCGWAIAQAVQP